MPGTFILFINLVLSSYKVVYAVDRTKLGLFDLSRRVSGNVSEYDLSRSLVPGKLMTEFLNFFLCKSESVLDLDDRCCNFAESLIGNTDHGYVFYSVMLS